MTDNRLTTNNNIFELEKQVMADLINFNKIYHQYIRCNHTYSGNDYFRVECVKNPPPDINYVNRAFALLINPDYPANSNIPGSLKKLLVALANIPSAANVNYSDSNANYEEIHRTITTRYNDLIQRRRELDTSLNELYEIGDTAGNFYQKKLISSSYIKILLTILATSLTVAAFMTMRNK